MDTFEYEYRIRYAPGWNSGWLYADDLKVILESCTDTTGWIIHQREVGPEQDVTAHFLKATNV